MDSECTILKNDCLKGLYRRIVFDAPGIAGRALPGQFVHVRITPMRDRILRRPFSISDADAKAGTLTLVYKIVGHGTEALAQMRPGESCMILGPQGKPYTLPAEGVRPVLVAGGYGAAATYLLAKRSGEKGVLLLGARSDADLILIGEYEKLGFEVRIATNDGSRGHKGFVTELLEEALTPDRKRCFVYGCGPEPMLLALGKRSMELGAEAELSLDQHMCCGVGACFACVVKVRDDASPDRWRYSRSCKEGPVYNAKEVYYG